MFFKKIVSLCIGLCLLSVVNAKEFPNKSIRVIVPFPAGGTVDQVARVVSNKMQDVLGQQIIIENKGGAGTLIGSDQVAKSNPDGYTLLWTATPLAINASLVPNMPYDSLRDLTMVGDVAAVPLVVIVPISSPAKTVQELVDMAKAKPATLNYGSSGVGGSSHLASAMFLHDAGITMNHIPYKGSAPAVTDLVGGHLDMVIDTLFLTRPYVESGRVRALAQSGATRSSLMPNVPTMLELGFNDYKAESWHVIAVPSATPTEVIAKLNHALNQALENPEVKSTLVEQGLELRGNTPEQANQHFLSEVVRWGQAVKNSGAQAQ